MKEQDLIIILLNGTKVSLSEFQSLYGIKSDQVGRYFGMNEFPNPFIMAEPVIRLADLVRGFMGKPLHLNSSYRSQRKQDELRKSEFRAAFYSPHVKGMAFDIDTTSEAETYALVAALEYCADLLGYKIRLGFKDYLLDGHTFVHVDVTPMYYGKGKIYNRTDHPFQWETERKW